jgi:hypothetical protein
MTTPTKGTRQMKIRALTLLTAAIFCSAVAIAAAEEVSVEAYVAAVEPICHKNTTANEKILGNVKKDVKHGKLKLAAAALAKAAAALNKTYAELAAVPKPGAEEAKLDKWLGYVKKEAALLSQTGKALKAGQKAKASRLETQLNHFANLANLTVLSFHFHYCRFEPSKFT